MWPSLPAWLAGSADSCSGSGSSSGGPAAAPPPPDAAARAASREAAARIARKLASAAEDIPGGAASGEVPKPYTVPPGYKAPTMGEQFRYAAMKHPYARYGYVAAVLVGLLGWAIATEEKKHGHGQQQVVLAPSSGGAQQQHPPSSSK